MAANSNDTIGPRSSGALPSNDRIGPDSIDTGGPKLSGAPPLKDRIEPVISNDTDTSNLPSNAKSGPEANKTAHQPTKIQSNDKVGTKTTEGLATGTIPKTLPSNDTLRPKTTPTKRKTLVYDIGIGKDDKPVH